MKAKITIEWEDGPTFRAPAVDIDPSELSLVEHEMFRPSDVGPRDIAASLSPRVDYVELTLRGAIRRSGPDDLLYEWEWIQP